VAKKSGGYLKNEFVKTLEGRESCYWGSGGVGKPDLGSGIEKRTPAQQGGPEGINFRKSGDLTKLRWVTEETGPGSDASANYRAEQLMGVKPLGD